MILPFIYQSSCMHLINFLANHRSFQPISLERSLPFVPRFPILKYKQKISMEHRYGMNAALTPRAINSIKALLNILLRQVYTWMLLMMQGIRNTKDLQDVFYCKYKERCLHVCMLVRSRSPSVDVRKDKSQEQWGVGLRCLCIHPQESWLTWIH